MSVCECERSNEPSIAQALHLMTSPEIGAKIQAPLGRAAKMAEDAKSVDQLIEDLYLSTISRLPRDDEKAGASALFADGADRRRAAEDWLWALLNSKEFLYNH